MKLLGYNTFSIGNNTDAYRKNHIGFGSKTNFTELKKTAFVSNFIAIEPSVLIGRLERSVAQLPAEETEAAAGLSILNKGFRKLLNILKEDQNIDTTSAVVKAFEMPHDSADEADKVKESLKKIVFDSTDEDRHMLGGQYQGFMDKLTNKLWKDKDLSWAKGSDPKYNVRGNDDGDLIMLSTKEANKVSKAHATDVIEKTDVHEPKQTEKKPWVGRKARAKDLKPTSASLMNQVAKKVVAMQEIRTDISFYTERLTDVNAELKRLNSLRNEQVVQSPNIEIEKKRESYISRIRALSHQKDKLSASVIESRLANLTENADLTNVTNKRILNKAGRYANKIANAPVKADNKALQKLKMEFAAFNKLHPSIEALTENIEKIRKILDFDKNYSENIAKIRSRAVLSFVTRPQINKYELQLNTLENENKLLQSFVGRVKQVTEGQSKKTVYEKIDYEKLISEHALVKPLREAFDTKDGFDRAQKNWSKKLVDLTKNQEHAKNYEENLLIIDDLKAKISVLEKADPQKAEAIQKLDVQKQKIDNFLSTTHSKTGKTGKEMLESTLAKLEVKRQNLISSKQNVQVFDQKIYFYTDKQHQYEAKIEGAEVRFKKIDRERMSLLKQLESIKDRVTSEEKIKTKRRRINPEQEYNEKMDYESTSKRTPTISEVEKVIKDIKELTGEDSAKSAKKIKKYKSRPTKVSSQKVDAAKKGEKKTTEYKMTPAIKVEFDNLKAILNGHLKTEGELREAYNECLYQLCGGNRNDYGAKAMARLNAFRERSDKLSRVKGEKEGKAKELIRKLVKNTSAEMAKEPESEGLYNILDDLETKLEKATGSEKVLLQEQFDAAFAKKQEIEAIKDGLMSEIKGLAEITMPLRKKADSLAYGFEFEEEAKIVQEGIVE